MEIVPQQGKGRVDVFDILSLLFLALSDEFLWSYGQEDVDTTQTADTP